ncbi:MAG: hypothetical protein GXY67_06700 [Clostridiales bacterium]|nr:hypothetical protein [Clostridiales bacterium]
MRCKPILRWVLCLCAVFWMSLLSLMVAQGTQDEEDVFLADAAYTPYIYVISPKKGASYDGAASLTVKAAGEHVRSIELELTGEEGTQRFRLDAEEVEHTFTFGKPQTKGASLIIRGYGIPDSNGKQHFAELRQEIPSPKEELVEKMIALAYANSKDSRYRFALAETDWDIGVCKNFVMRLFDTFAKDYRMLEYPELALHMPVNNSKKACAPYDYGIEWKPEGPETGNPFEIAAQFKYNTDLSESDNAALARQLLVHIRKGDFFQIVGYYGGGNGPHSMYIIADYDPATEMIRWTDSNMRGTRIDGVRWGYLQYDADAPVDWWIDVFNRKWRGATLYRLRDDLYHY